MLRQGCVFDLFAIIVAPMEEIAKVQLTRYFAMKRLLIKHETQKLALMWFKEYGFY